MNIFVRLFAGAGILSYLRVSFGFGAGITPTTSKSESGENPGQYLLL